jgi:hypothetical protein
MKSILPILLLTTVFSSAVAQDSTKSYLQILPRLHAGGFFPFTGALLNHNPVADVNVFFERKALGFFVFQSVDLKDRHSYVNYLQPGVFATLKLHPTFKARAFFGYIFSQAQGFRDKDSDFYAATTLYWDPTDHITVQNTVLYYDFTIQGKIANRLMISWYTNKVKAEFYLWNRVVLEEKRQAVSASVALTFPIIKVGDRTHIELTSAYMWYLTSYRPSFALSDGFRFTLGVPIEVIK